MPLKHLLCECLKACRMLCVDLPDGEVPRSNAVPGAGWAAGKLPACRQAAAAQTLRPCGYSGKQSPEPENPEPCACRYQRAQCCALGAGRAPHEAHLPGSCHVPFAVLIHCQLRKLPDRCTPPCSPCSYLPTGRALLLPAAPSSARCVHPKLDTLTPKVMSPPVEVRLGRVVLGRLAGAAPLQLAGVRPEHAAKVPAASHQHPYRAVLRRASRPASLTGALASTCLHPLLVSVASDSVDQKLHRMIAGA